ncbi:MAG: AbgT family transporter [Clostridium sp.]
MKAKKQRKSLFQKFLDGVERVGNALPHPVTIFFILCIVVIIASHICYKLGVSVPFTQIDRKTNEVKDTVVSVVSLLTPEGIRFIFESAVTNFTGFAPLGTVLVAMLGVGVAEGTGLISTLIRKVVLSTPKSLITAVVVLAGIMSNIASDAGYIVLIPLGALIFASFKRHPMAGIAAAFAGVSGGFSANLMIGTIDPLLAGLSTEAAKMVDPNYVVGPTANYYFMVVSTFLITILGTLITEKIVEPRLGEYKGGTDEISLDKISGEEKKGLLFAGLSLVVLIAVTLFLTVPAGAILRNPETGSILKKSPFMNGIVFIIMIYFLVPAIAYGIGAGTIKNDKQVVSAMSKSMASMGGYLVLAFFASQFIAYFNYSQLGTVIAVNGAKGLEAMKLTGLPLMVCFIILTGFINLFMGSASAKWAIMAPIFIPMFMQLGFSPELTQIAYRIGDSTTNIISPLMSYFAFIVTVAETYDEDAGIGTIISTMLPYSLIFMLGWSVLLMIWMYFGLPIGPGAPLAFPA